MSQPYAPGPVPRPAAPAYVPPRQRLGLARVGVIAVMIAAVVSSGLNVALAYAAGVAADLDPAGGSAELNGLQVPDEVVDRIVQLGTISLVASVLLLLTMVLGGVGAIRWQTRALQNFGALAVPPPRLTTTVAGVCWFVPVWSLFGPKQTFDDIWRSGDPRLPAYPPAPAFRAAAVSGLLTAWWACWVVGSLVGALTARIPITTLSGLVGGVVASVAINALLVVSGVLFLRVLRRAGERQDARYAALVGAAQPGLPGQTVTESGSSDAWWAPGASGPAAWTNP